MFLPAGFVFGTLAFWAAFTPGLVHASVGDARYADQLVTRALEQKLWESPYWWRLLHYAPAFWGGVKSRMKADGFFLSPEGRHDPRAELEATLRSFFNDPLAPGEEAPPELKEHPQCLFRDRYLWLREKLGAQANAFDRQRLPEQPCPGFDEWRGRLNPASATLVFSSYYLHNPTSAFGHTLLRLNNGRYDSKARLLDWGINYSADQTTANALVYGLAGVFGGLPGRFSNIPYYLKVEEYSNIESRDLWEYDLNLDSAALDRMMAHLWTVGHFAFPYYFFDGNCSYMLLALLEAADPSLQLTSKLPGWAIPADTLRVVASQANLVRNVTFRPSLATRILRRRERLSAEGDARFRELISMVNDADAKQDAAISAVAGLQRGEAAAVIEAALEVLQFRRLETEREIRTRFNAEEPSQAPETPYSVRSRAFRQKLLIASSEIPRAAPESVTADAKSQERMRPDAGHRSFQIHVGTGSASGSVPGVSHLSPFWQFGARFAFHDWNASPVGYPANAQIEMLGIQARYFSKRADRRFQLERIDWVNVRSITPWDPVFRKSSWQFRMTWEPVRDLDCDSCRQFRMGYGTGYAAEVGMGGMRNALTAFALVGGELGIADSFGDRLNQRYRLSPGGSAGFRLMPAHWLSWASEAQAFLAVLGRTGAYWALSSELRASFEPLFRSTFGSAFDLRIRGERQSYWSEISVRLNFYL